MSAIPPADKPVGRYWLWGKTPGGCNPIDKFVQVFEENKKLYEQLLQTEKEKIALLEKMLNKK